MAQFQFQSGVKTLDVKDSNGEVVKSYSIDVGQKEKTKKWIKEINELQKVGDKFSEDENAIDELEVMERKVVNAILGETAFDELFTISGSNVFSMLSFVKYLSSFLNDAMQAFYKDYV